MNSVYQLRTGLEDVRPPVWRQELQKWLGAPLDAGRFDPAEVNLALREL